VDFWNNMSFQTENDIETIIDLVEISNKSVLELGCGNGRITFKLAEMVQEIVAIDIDTKAIEDARESNKYENVLFLVENMEDFDLKRKFDVILSVGVGYMYVRDLLSAVKNISQHLEDDGIALLICSSPDSEYERVIDLLVEENIKSVSFYNRFEKILSDYFTFKKKQVKGQLIFSDFEETLQCFQRYLKDEYAIDTNDQHEEVLKGFFQRKGIFTVEDDTQAYICKHL
jgi:SAM-dependent methyltransferase